MRSAIVLLLALLASACTSADKAPLSVADVSITPPMAGMDMRAAYMLLTNNGDAAISLTSFTSPQFAAVELHESLIESGIARMRPLGELVIAGGESIRLEPGGKHLMLGQSTLAASGATPDARASDTIRLDFYSREDLVLSINVAGNNP